jgi:hypothetical protein
LLGLRIPCCDDDVVFGWMSSSQTMTREEFRTLSNPSVSYCTRNETINLMKR